MAGLAHTLPGWGLHTVAARKCGSHSSWAAAPAKALFLTAPMNSLYWRVTASYRQRVCPAAHRRSPNFPARVQIWRYPGFGTITIDINLNNGAIDGLSALVSQVANSDDTNFTSGPLTPQVPTFVDSATSPEAVGFSSANLTPLPTYVVPLVYIKNTNSLDTAAITNLTQRQAVTLETASLGRPFWGHEHKHCLFRRTK